MKVSVNGEPREIGDAANLMLLIESVTGTLRGSAVVVDGEVVPRSAWREYPLRDGQSIELITAVQGG